MTTTTPTLCIGMPVYNGETYIEEALDSVLGQTYTDFEVVIVDNASTDRTREIAEAYVVTDPRVRYVRNEVNLGAAVNFNLALEHCRSPFFKWVAVDDPVGPTMFERCMAALEANPEAVLAYPETGFIDQQSTMLYAFAQRVDVPVWDDDVVRRGRQAFKAILADGSTANVLVFGIMRTERLRRARGMGSYFGADLPMMADVVLQGQVIEVPGLNVFLRRHTDSSSTYDHRPDARKQQDFYDPSVSGRLRLHWNLRRRYVSLLQVALGAPTSPAGRLRLAASYLGSVVGRIRWRLGYERAVRRGEKPHDPQWAAAGAPRPHWREVVGQPSPT